MRTMILVFCCLITSALAITACGGNGSTPDAEPAPVLQDQPTAPEFNLGSLEGLPAPNHEVSTEGPAWYELELFANLASAGVVNPHPIDELPLIALSDPAYAIYGVYGFDGDNGPTSARVTGGNYSGEYYVGFSDYVEGNWVFSGPYTADATAEIPLDADHLSQNAFTDENGHCFVAVVVEPGGSLTLTSLELGLHGGTEGPRPPAIWTATSNADGIQVRWFDSEDVMDPDFAGYHVERAPLFSGGFADLNTHPIMDTAFIDDTAVAGETYRYRIRAVDTAGNGNVSMTFNFAINPLTLMDPVPVLNIPKGPLYGPISLPFDLSGSYDPEGQPIDTYNIQLVGGLSSYTGPNSAPVIDLQPGNYKIYYSVLSGPRGGGGYTFLKIYPKWNAPIVANPSVPTYPRGLWLSAGVLPSTGRVAVATSDMLSEHFTITTENQFGELESARLWVGENAHCVQSPVVMQDNLVFLVQTPGQHRVVNYDGSEARSLLSISPYAQTVASLAGDGNNRLFTVVCIDMGGSYDLRVLPNGAGIPSYTPAFNVGHIDWIHAVYNPGVDALDIVYNIQTTKELYWVRDDFSGVPVTPIEIVAGGNCNTPILAINPDNHRPMVAYNDLSDGFVKFSALTSDLTTWTVPETIDNSLPNLTIHSLVYSDGYPIAGIGLNDGTYNIYRRGAGWLKTNTLLDSNTTLALCTVIDTPEPHNLAVAYTDTALVTNYFDCNFDGTNTLNWQMPGVTPNGIELHGAAGSDGLHAVFFAAPGDLHHLISPDGGSWAPGADIATVENFDIVGTAAGEIYLSYYDAPSMQLDYWDGATWNNVTSIPTGPEYRQILSYNVTDARVDFACFNTTLTQMSYNSCLQGTPTTTTTIDHGQPIWGGLVDHHGNSAMLAKGTSATSSVMNLGAWAAAGESPLVYGGASMMFRGGYYTKGKTIAFSHHCPMVMMGESYSFLLTSSLTGEALRIDRVGIIPETIVYIDDLELINYSGQRRTVTSLHTQSGTGVVLFSEVEFDDHYFAWSNFGEWETLPLPYGVENMMSAELVCGMDGRWHLLYRDWVTDDLMCVSTR